LDQAGPLSFEAGGGSASPAFFFPDPGYGRVPVGNGHAAAGFSAVLAPVLAAVDGAGAALGAIVAGLASGLAALLAFFFLPAFFFFLAD